MSYEEKNTEVSGQLDCKDCGALLKFAPGTNSLKCEYCGAQNEISSAPQTTVVEEIDFEKFLNENTVSEADKQQVTTVGCKNCGANTTLKPNVASDNCPFCDTPLVVQGGGNTSSIIKPKYVLPFAIDKKKGGDEYKKWVGSLWFAPNDLKRFAETFEKLNGMYIPYWTYDSNTDSSYSGMRGDNYMVTETYTAFENGKSVTRTRTVTKVRWTPAAGSVNNEFDDVLVLASKSLPDKYAYALEPWDLENLSAFDEKFLSGFRTETYQVDVKGGFDVAKTIMEKEIRNTVRRDIGGDHQQILTLNSNYNDITFKHILLPVWLSAYRYNDKVYRFMINARTGEVQGERPYSWIKITLTALTVIALGLAIWWFATKS
jgi:LSD1 subclass zinc finger protein